MSQAISKVVPRKPLMAVRDGMSAAIGIGSAAILAGTAILPATLLAAGIGLTYGLISAKGSSQ